MSDSLSKRLRDDAPGRLMPFQTLRLILETHRANTLNQGLYAFQWRYSDGKATIFDMDYPRRNGLNDDIHHGRGESEWWFQSTICNVDDQFMLPWDLRSKKTNETIRPGYKKVLMQLLADGCVRPSKVLDEWLLDDSRKFCKPHLRIFYIDN